MFDIGWSELLVIGMVALIVVGPKDLPLMFKALGQFTGKARAMARDFQRAMEQAADEAGVKDVAKDLRAVTSVKNMGLDAVKTAATKFENWDTTKRGVATDTEVSTMGPATAELAAKLKANAAALEAGFTPEELADVEPDILPEHGAEPTILPAAKPARKPRVKAAPAAEVTPVAKPAAKPRAAKAEATAAAKPATRNAAKPKAETIVADGADTAKPAAKPRKTSKKSDA
ncbi:Sec-independent protein translocase protein TatB [mine drainage metagenome]|uniref:Sec-independent protein translocase protein TatB n=1 Tax=mine drainage metagenome TaxID=410659 RepID=A0A1J5PL92_9ZZZZ